MHRVIINQKTFQVVIMDIFTTIKGLKKRKINQERSHLVSRIMNKIALITLLSLGAIEENYADNKDYIINVSQTSCEIFDPEKDKSIKVNLKCNSANSNLVNSLMWELKESILHPNSGGRMYNIYVTGSLGEKNDFMMEGWYIKEPFLEETIDIHKDVSLVNVVQKLNKKHFGHPATSGDSVKFLAFMKWLKINRNDDLSIAWVGKKPVIIQTIEQTK